MKSLSATVSGRLDIFLSNEGVAESRIKVRDLIKNGHVMVNGRIARKPALIVEEGDTVEVTTNGEPATETKIEGVDLKLSILYEDDACFVLMKPAGIPVHPGVGIPKDAPTILHGIVHLFKEKGLPFSSAAALVHRLDKDTTGCLLVAKSAAIHKQLQQQFADRTVKKFYLAIVAGVPDPEAALIDASIGRSATDRTKMAISAMSNARSARTTYRTLDATNDCALLSCELHTGRTHQIRVHLQSIGHPLLGDPAYQSAKSSELSEKFHIDSLCLHAWKLSFVSPADEKEHTVECPPSDQFISFLEHTGLRKPS